MKKIMLALAAVACLSAPALADEDGSGYADHGPTYGDHGGYVGRHDDCDHGDRGYDRYRDRDDWRRGDRDHRFERDGYERY